MIKPVPHSPAKRKSVAVLGSRVRYIADNAHKNHQNKIVLPSRNHRCGGQETTDFFSAITKGIQRYSQRREGKPGKRTGRSWGEYCYSSEEGTVPRKDGTGMEPCLSAEEREESENVFLAGPLGRGSCRHGWHIDLVTGRCDWHCLAGEHDELGVIWPNDGFGKGMKCLKLELERIEEVLLARLNRKRPPERQLKTARQRHREKRKKAGKLTCAQKLAAGKWDGSPEKLTEAAEQAGYVVHTQTKKSITVQSLDCKKRPKKIRYGIATLTQNWTKAKAKSFLKKPPKSDDPDVTKPDL
jgi:hypothetical protein